MTRIFLNSGGLLRSSSQQRLKLAAIKKKPKKLSERSTSFSSAPFLFEKTRRLPCLPVSYRTLLRLTIFLIILSTLLLGLGGYQLQGSLPQLAERLSQNPSEGSLVFFALIAFWTLLLVPPPLLALIAGFSIQPLPLAISVATAGSAIGQACSFLIGRSFLLSLLVEGGSSKLAPLRASVAEEGWRFVFLLRLASAVSFSCNAFNYVLALTDIKIGHHLFASVMGSIPGLALYTLFGSLLSNMDKMLKGQSDPDADPDRKVKFVLLAISGAAIILAASLISTMAQKAVEQALEKRASEAKERAQNQRTPSNERVANCPLPEPEAPLQEEDYESEQDDDDSEGEEEVTKKGFPWMVLAHDFA